MPGPGFPSETQRIPNQKLLIPDILLIKLSEINTLQIEDATDPDLTAASRIL